MTPSDPQQDAADADTRHTLRTCQPFDPVRLRRQLRLDTSVRWFVFIALGLCVAMTSLLGEHGSELSLGIMVVVVAVVWAGAYHSSARAAQHLAHLTEMIDADTAAAESLLAGTMTRWPLQRHLRLLLYHRLARLRHVQKRLAESGLICRTLLSEPRGVTRDVRVHMLLMLLESNLHFHDLWGAHTALAALARVPLNLFESLHRMGLQMRYEILSGHHGAVLHDLDRKVQMAELLPAADSGLVHAMMASAAEHTEQTELAAWLRSRTQLLCTPQQVEQIRSADWMA